jgi:hypothetical protein
MRKATPLEVDEHGRWRYQMDGVSEAMHLRYNQWELVVHVAITLFCQ